MIKNGDYFFAGDAYRSAILSSNEIMTMVEMTAENAQDNLSQESELAGEQAPELENRPCRVLIVDSSPFRSDQLRATVEQQPGFVVCADSFSALEALSAIERHQPDVIFLDVNISRAEALRPIFEFNRKEFDNKKSNNGESHNKRLIVYVQGSDARLQSRNHQSTFLFEGKRTTDFHLVLARVRQRFARSKAPGTFPSLAVLTKNTISVLRGRLALKSESGLMVLSLSSIQRIERGSSGSVVYAEGSAIPTRYAMRHFAAKLPKDVFWQLNSSLLVNICTIREIRIEPGTRASLVLDSGDVVTVGQRYARRLMKFLSRSFGVKAV